MSRRIINEFGVQIYGATIGDTWAGLVRAVLDLGSQCFDEDRERIALSNVRIKSSVQNYPDLTIEEHCNSAQLKAMLDFMFNTDTMEDIDVVKSFSRGAKSYHRRIKEGRMIEFVIERLSLIPESKKAVVVFPTYEDYAAVMRNHNNPPAPPGCPGAVPCAPSPISGRPSSVWVGAFTAPSTTRIAAALAISVAVYHLAAAVSVCTNWS